MNDERNEQLYKYTKNIGYEGLSSLGRKKIVNKEYKLQRSKGRGEMGPKGVAAY